jgi:DNA-binding response OmpR family regulator
MKTVGAKSGLRALVAVDEGALRLTEILSQRGISATIVSSPDEALRECRANSPHLAIVAGAVGGITGVRFLRELLNISWETFTILIMDEDEEAVHTRAEGLGILGSIRTADDTEGFEKLLDKFCEMVSAEQP